MHDHANCHHDEHEGRNPDAVDQPTDAASESLADALRASFGILKVIMLVLVVLYLFSNVRRIEGHEQALTLRLGQLLPKVGEAGLVWAFPYPIDEIVPLPTKKSNNLIVDTHTFHRRPQEIGKPLAFIMRGPHQGLDPALDGALLTADSGLVHTEWKVTYKIDDVSKFVTRIIGDRVESAERLISSLVETAGVELASGFTAEELIRTRVDEVQTEMRRHVNQRLRQLDSGIAVTLVEMNQPTPPIAVRVSFEQTQRAENDKQKRIREAEQSRTQILHEVAGPRYATFLTTLDELNTAPPSGAHHDAIQQRINRMLIDELEGEAGRLVREAETYHSVVVGEMESDLHLYEELVPQFKRNPKLLVNRLYEEALQQIMNNADITKIYRPARAEIRLEVGLDPNQTRESDTKRLKKKKFDVTKLRKRTMHPLGPEAG